MGLGKKIRDNVTDPSTEASPTAEELAAQADVLTHSQCEQAASATPKPEAPPRTRRAPTPTRVSPRAQLEHVMESDTEQPIRGPEHNGQASALCSARSLMRSTPCTRVGFLGAR